MKWPSVVLALLVGCFVGLWEVAVSPWLPNALQAKPMLAIVILFLAFRGRGSTLLVALSGVLIADAFTIGLFDAGFLRWIILVLIIDVVMQRILTNHSLPALIILVLGGRLFERGLYFVIGYLAHWTGWQIYQPVLGGFGFATMVWDMVIVTIGFLLISVWTPAFSRRKTGISGTYSF